MSIRVSHNRLKTRAREEPEHEPRPPISPAMIPDFEACAARFQIRNSRPHFQVSKTLFTTIPAYTYLIAN
jgi:hypothetical protein